MFGFLAFDDNQPICVIIVIEAMALVATGVYGIITELNVVPEHRQTGVAKLLIYAASEGWRRGAPQ